MNDAHVRAAIYPPHWRAVAGLLAAISAASLLVIVALLLFVDAGLHNPLRLIRIFVALCMLPGLAALLVQWAFSGVAITAADKLVLQQRHRRSEIPLADIASAEPWVLPLPGSGLRLSLRSGRRWRDGVQVDDPAMLVEKLIEAGARSDLRAAAHKPSAVYAQAKKASRRYSVGRFVFKFPVFALVPAVPLFRVHQLIAYGGAFGEYQQYGLKAYLLGFAIYWATLTIYLLLYAAVLRLPAEIIAMASAAVAPRRAPTARRIVDSACAVLFYVGVPAFVVLRFLPW